MILFIFGIGIDSGKLEHLIISNTFNVLVVFRVFEVLLYFLLVLWRVLLKEADFTKLCIYRQGRHGGAWSWYRWYYDRYSQEVP